jgi:AcrR family transcriptional regulator
MYNYFDSKEALLRAIFTESLRDVQASFDAANQGGTPQEKIERLLRSSFELVRQNQPFWRLYHGLRLQPVVLEKLGGDIDQWVVSIEKQLELYMTELGYSAPAIEAKILFALVDGIVQHYVIAPENYPLDAVATRAIQRYCGGTS